MHPDPNPSSQPQARSEAAALPGAADASGKVRAAIDRGAIRLTCPAIPEELQLQLSALAAHTRLRTGPDNQTTVPADARQPFLLLCGEPA